MFNAMGLHARLASTAYHQAISLWSLFINNLIVVVNSRQCTFWTCNVLSGTSPDNPNMCGFTKNSSSARHFCGVVGGGGGGDCHINNKLS